LELQLVIACIRAFTGHDKREMIEALCCKAIDWDAFTLLVDRHRVPTAVYNTLNTLSGENIPDATLDRLKKRSRRKTQQVLARAAELVRTVQLFEQGSIPALPLKGPVLAMQSYGDLGSRHVGDLDIMVSPESLEMAEDILTRQGYQRIHPDFQLTRKQRQIYMRNVHHFAYFSQDKGIEIELHWRFGPNPHLFPLTFEDLWKDRQIIRLGGADMACLSLEHTILLICTHGAIHAWFRLFWLNDLALIVTKNDSIDWDMLMHHAIRLGLARMVAQGMILANRLLGSFLPEPVWAFAKSDKHLQRFVKASFYLIRYQGEMPYTPHAPAYWHHKYNSFMLRSNLKYKLGFCFKHLDASHTDLNRISLPNFLFPLYYFIRPVTWFLRWYARWTKVYREGPMGRRTGNESTR